ncbi:hypothetical protein [Lysobacter antibioticus]|uniref:hypothetical protein n=1 Tax=Lysobacter antibioticus TaxID=84531 RepID=UPI00034A4EB3|nr:hypothetical protein [Lysobacter antibioticus]
MNTIRNTGSPGSLRHPLWIRANWIWAELKQLETALRASGLDIAANEVSTSILYTNKAVVLLQDAAPVAEQGQDGAP